VTMGLLATDPLNKVDFLTVRTCENGIFSQLEPVKMFTKQITHIEL